MMHRCGETGVQTHIRDALGYLDDRHCPPQFVGPEATLKPRRALYSLTRLLSGGLPTANPLRRYLIDRVFALTLRSELERRLRGQIAWTVYAQDPLCASVALGLRDRPAQRVVLAVHFNVSQADEMAVRGIVKIGDWLYRRTQRQEREALCRADGVVFFSRFMEEQIRLRGIMVRSSIVIPHTAAPVETDRQAEPGDLIAVGTLEPRKNQAYLLLVLHEAALRGHRYRLTIVGSGEDRQSLERLAVRLGVQGQVVFLGMRPAAASLLAMHKVFVHAARMEAFGIALVEALAAGLPVLAPRVGGIPEIVRDGIEGYFWPLDDPAEGARLLMRLMEDPLLRQRMARAASRRLHDRFDRNTIGGRLAAYVRTDSRAGQLQATERGAMSEDLVAGGNHDRRRIAAVVHYSTLKLGP
ncbi:MAG: glycosyltransferase family 4 protein [Terracidiphilus sp.]